MYKNKNILALIPARGGSKGIPGKNIKLLSEKPLIAWTIEEAKKSRYIDRIVVSTESEKIAEISKRYGAEIPFLRPKELAGDRVSGTEVVLHTIEWMEKRSDKMYNMLMLLQPTSPLRTVEDIDGAIEMFFEKDAFAVISVCEAEHCPLWANTLPEDGCMKNFIKTEVDSKIRQELGKFYRLNGAIFLVYIDYIKKEKSFFGDKTFAYIMPQEKSVDIDTEIDFKLAEVLKKTRIK